MDSGLKYTSEQYRKALFEYIDYTILIETPIGLLRQKIDKRSGISVIAETNERFKIFMDYQPIVKYAVDPSLINQHFKKKSLSIITFGNDICIKIQRNNMTHFIYVFCYILALVTIAILALKNDPLISILTIILTPLPFIFEKIKNKRLTNMIIDFLNDVAGGKV